MRDNDVSAHAQTVAKAKYEFLFGLAEEKPSEMGKCYLLLLFTKKKKKSLMPLRKVLQKLLPNDPTRAHALCYAVLLWTTVQVPDQKSLLVWFHKMTAVPCLMASPFSWALLGHLDVTVASGVLETCWWGSLRISLQQSGFSHVFCDCMWQNTATSA